MFEQCFLHKNIAVLLVLLIDLCDWEQSQKNSFHPGPTQLLVMDCIVNNNKHRILAGCHELDLNLYPSDSIWHIVTVENVFYEQQEGHWFKTVS